MKKVWEGMNLMSGRKKVNKPSVLCTSNDYANELNDFYARFDCHDFSSEKERIVNELLNANEMYNDVIIDEFDVLKAMTSVNTTKASGPDNISPKVIKVCADQLCGIFSFIFNLSLSDCQIPEQWKTSCIIPVPKRPNVKVMNDYRPIALTSCIMKIFERVFIAQLQRITLPLLTRANSPTERTDRLMTLFYMF